MAANSKVTPGDTPKTANTCCFVVGLEVAVVVDGIWWLVAWWWMGIGGYCGHTDTTQAKKWGNVLRITTEFVAL